MEIKFKKTINLLKSDFARYKDVSANPFNIIFQMFIQPGMIFCLIYRLERYFLYSSNIFLKLLGKISYPFYFLISYYFLSYHIEPEVKIDGGLLLHNRDIIMTENVSIGRNFSCMGQTTIGLNQLRGTGKVRIGDNVFLGVGAKIIATGSLFISNGVEIGANAVVTKNLNVENGVYFGIPAKLHRVLKK